MGFSSRLKRFANASGQAPDAASPSDDDETHGPVDAAAPSRVSVLPATREAVLLDDLRARMAKALAKHENKSTRSRDLPDHEPTYRESLPLETIENGSGSFERRMRLESPLARVGGVELTEALEANLPWLSVLALDESLAPCRVEGALFLDTETTGLAGGTGTLAFLVGLAWWNAEEQRFSTELLFLPNFSSEAAMLEHLESRLRVAEFLVTFNGKSFDLPLLKTRFALNRRPFPFDAPHLDLLHVARRLHRGRDFGVRLQALEQALFGLERVDDIPSAHVAQAYLAWLRGGDSTPVRAVLEHNVQDVLTMIGLVALYGKPPASSTLQGQELVAAARTATKAKAHEQARAVLAAAEDRGVEASFAREFHLAKAALCKHEAAWTEAATNLEEARAWLDDDRVRLDLAKIYEHRLRDVRTALELAEQGTGEAPATLDRRKTRLSKKSRGKPQTKLPGFE